MYKQLLCGTPLLLPADGRGRELMEGMLSSLSGVEEALVGYSILQRPIKMYKFGKGRGRVVFFGAHHALESITANILYTFIYIMNSPERAMISAEDLPSLFTSLYTYYVVPCLNPDGIEIRFNGDASSVLHSRILRMTGGDLNGWQANARGVDLNHNYEYGFAEYKAIEYSRGITAGKSLYSGEYPESEPESRLAASLVRILNPKAVVSLHSQGEEIYYAPSASRNAAQALAKLTGYTATLPTDTAAYGGLCDYAGYALGIPSFTLEIGRGSNPLPEADIPAVAKRIIPALMLLPRLV